MPVRLLLISSRFPLPRLRGNQVRTMEWLAALAGSRLGLVAPAPAAAALPSELAGQGVGTYLYRHRKIEVAPSLVGGLLHLRPAQEGLYGTRSARTALRRALADGPWDLAVIQMVRCAWAVPLLQRQAPELPILFDTIDAMGQHYRRSLSDYPLLARPLLLLEAAACQRRERWLARQAVLSTAVSQRDLDALGMAAAGQWRVVPVAARPPVTAAPPLAASCTVLLSGNLGYRPTVSGARWFARQVWPRLRQQLPAVRWVLAGARPHRVIRRLAGLAGVELCADVADLAPFLASASVAIAPMFTGSGVPIKVLEAWAAGLPVVAAPWAAAGLQGDGQGLVVAATADEWVAGLVQLLRDRSAASRVAAAGHRTWERWYRPQRVAELIREAVQAACAD